MWQYVTEKGEFLVYDIAWFILTIIAILFSIKLFRFIFGSNEQQ
ncbi:hypothetical protein BARVI_12040 [Barnesiella viscericola DSM 18177]|uniref:Uncharacterized protein n=1 Tax=Barnesiella viscericola DSM 18177 TaxID=880074 RepID=W0ET80_9BACT|nr:hypothetical protein BARVI_12040 [Barnesiella viscericola DSM 18177]